MNSLLIYNMNVPISLKYGFEEKLGDAVSFEISASDMLSPSFTVDRKISEFLLGEELERKQYDSIIIPYSLSDENYVEFLGLRMAYHIRLTSEFKNIQTPIIFYGLDSAYELNKLSDLGQILFTKNIYQTKRMSIPDFQSQIEYIKNSLISKESTNGEFTKEFVRKTHVSPPGNYLSHHSIDNELALLRWSEYIGCDNEIPEVRFNLQTGLFFKHHTAEHPIKKNTDSKRFLIKGKAKILLIDDEAEKGWDTFYESFFKLSPSITFESLKINYQKLTQDEIIKEALDKIADFDADVVLLDLRLFDSDFDESTKPEDITGAQILNKIKQKINKGTQVIITTASNKVWNHKATTLFGADGYIVKNGEGSVDEKIREINDAINYGIFRAEYLKKAFVLFNSIRNHIINSIKDKKANNTFGRELIQLLDIAIEMYSSSSTKSNYAYSYLSLFKALELLVTEYVFINHGKWQIIGPIELKQYRWSKESNNYEALSPQKFNNNTPSTFDKTAGICFQLLDWDKSSVKEIYYSIKRRNQFIHPSEAELNKKVQDEHDKIYNEKGFEVLLKQLSRIIIKLM